MRKCWRTQPQTACACARSIAVYALALADLGRADWPEALARLESLLEGGAAQLDPLAAATTPDRIEAAVKAGRYEIAQAALPQLEARAAYAGARQMQPRLAACRALLAEGDAASEHFEDALRLGGRGATIRPGAHPAALRRAPSARAPSH